MIIVCPTPHRPRNTSPHFEVDGSKNQSGGWSTPSPLRIWFTGPTDGLRMNTNASAAATGGASVGRK